MKRECQPLFCKVVYKVALMEGGGGAGGSRRVEKMEKKDNE